MTLVHLIPLSCGETTADLTVLRTKATVHHKLRWPGGQLYRDDAGNDKHPRVVDALVVTLVTADGRAFEARSCCIPPDVFTYREGLRRALKRLYALPDFPPELVRHVRRVSYLRRFGGKGLRYPANRAAAPRQETSNT